MPKKKTAHRSSARKKSPVRKRRPAAAKRAVPRRRHVSGAGAGISTNSKRHTDYNRNKTYITVGSIQKDKKRARDKIETLIGQEEVRKFKAKKVRLKKKIQKKISALKSDYRRLCL